MTNPEILERFDALYNNIMSLKAPGLDAYEKSIFWNKATLEVLKNHLNPKGNKYGEGFDNSSKRQLDFSSLVVKKSYSLFPKRTDNIDHVVWVLAEIKTITSGDDDIILRYEVADIDINPSSMLTILNESLNIVENDMDFYTDLAKTLMIGDIAGFDYNEDGKISIADVTQIVAAQLSGNFPEYLNPQDVIDYLLGNSDEQYFVFEKSIPAETIIKDWSLKTKQVTVVPINYIEYDTLVSRPYPYPPKSLAWRLFLNGTSEIIIDPNWAPYRYTIRYVKIPKEINLENPEDTSDVPEILHDEILQRAVELAKNAWEGNIETSKTFGERSE